MEGLQEFFETLTKLDDFAEFAKEFKENAPAAYQYVWNGGHKTATNDAKETIQALEDRLKEYDAKAKRLKNLTELEGQVESLEADRKKLLTKIEELGKAQPDLQALQDRHEAVLLRKDEEHQEELKRFKKELDGWRGKYSTSNIDRVISGVISTLVSEGVDRDYATVQTQRPGFRDRIRQSDDGEITGALQKDGSTPFPLSEGQSVASALAKELLSDVPDKWREDRRQEGAGVGSGGTRLNKVTESDLKNLSDEEFLAVVEKADQAAKQGKSVIVAD